MKLETTYSDNITGKGPDQYRSQRFSVTLSREIPDTEDPNQQAGLLFQAARACVSSQVSLAKGDQAFNSLPANNTRTIPDFSQPNTQPGKFNSQSNNNNPRPATEKQIKFLFQLGKRAGLSNEQISALPNQYFGKAVLQQLTSKECSQLIDSLNGENRKAA
ncbi:MAG: hypothetical protein HQK83_04560 [Fibrobacteria bacterium]|nr:hypothetical protein [Fibrobacteria bacterium]